jgi:hypothetical protein
MFDPGFGVYIFDNVGECCTPQCSGLTPNFGHAGSLVCKQARDANNSNTSDIEQVPYTPHTNIDHQSLQWQARVMADGPSMHMVENNMIPREGFHIIFAHMGLRPQALMLMFLAMSVARPPYASFHPRRFKRITQLGWNLPAGANKRGTWSENHSTHKI